MQHNNCKNNSHSRKLLSGIPTSFSNTQGGDPRQKHSGMTIKKQVILNRGLYHWAAPRKVVIRGLIKLIQDLQRLPFSFLNNLRGRCQIKFGMTFLFSNSGFTLIELLVVVLIIGILTAVALPQYQVAVAKSNVSAILPLAKGINDALEVYFLANGQYPTADMELTDLDISLPNDCTRIEDDETGTTLVFSCGKNFVFQTSDGVARFNYCPNANQTYTGCLEKRDLQIAYIGNYYANPSQRGEILCAQKNNSKLGNKICSNFGNFKFSDR